MDKSLPDTRPFASFERMLSMRYLRARRRDGFISVISAISLIGIALGVATLIVVMAVLNGFRATLLEKILGSSGHASVYAVDAAPLTGFDDLAARLLQIPGVVSVVPFVEGQALASSARNNTGILVRGVREADIAAMASLNNDALRTAFKEPGVPDEPPGFTGFDASEGVVIGDRLAWKHQVGLGSTLTLISPEGPDTIMGTAPRIRDYRVVGVFKIGMSEYDEGIAYLPFAEAQDYFDVGEGASAIEIKVEDPDRIDDQLAAIQEAVGPGLQVQTWKQRYTTFFSALEVERNVMFLVLTMIILVAALNIISGLIMLVKDKGHDIAILRTMGATSGAIQRVFFMTGAAIGLVGTLAGLLLGLVICANVESIRQFVSWISGSNVFPPEIYYLSKLPADMDPWQTAMIVLMALALSFVATLYPAWRAARLDPVEALRYA